MKVDCLEFIHLVNSQLLAKSSAQLITVSDGSDNSGLMTFGWAIALPNGQRLATCAGPAYGPSSSSFHAKGYGFLSVSRFLVRLFEFCLVQPAWVIQMMTDNQGLLTRIESSYPHPERFPNLTLLLDWDVTHEITKSILSFGRKPLLVHVEGHQDTHTPYSKLPLDTQLNVDADTEAGAYQCTYLVQRPSIPCLPSKPAQLRIKGKVICARLKQRIREAALVPDYLAYVAKRFGWDKATADLVDWQAYTQAIGRFCSQRIQITKLCHDLLLTARWANRYDSLITAHCLHCGELEDRYHVLRRTFGPRQAWRNKRLSTLRKAHNSDLSDHYLTDILVTFIDCWFCGTTINNN
jgi:hypothetical protein